VLSPIITTKLYIPPPPSNLVPRSSLIEILNQGINKKLTIISAPAGFGKTTLLSECVAQCGYPVAWYSLDEGDDDLARFIAYLVAALQSMYPKIDAKESFGAFSQSSEIEYILAQLINQIAQSSTQAVLVLDDYHEIESLEIDQAISFFVANMPANFHLVIATRTDPIFPLSRLRSRGQLTELRADDMRFTPEEVVLFLSEGMGLSITPEDIIRLEIRTEGWIAGLQLAAISLQRITKPSEISQFIEDFSSSNRYILDYLTDEVLQRRPVGTRDFLLQTSILNRFNASVCNAVTNRDDSQKLLESLEASNLFLVPLDNQRIWYRYHHLFGDMLQARLLRSEPNIIPDLHQRASIAFETADLMSEAITHSLSAEDFNRAAQLTEQTFFDRMSRGEDFDTMMARLAALPDEIVRARLRLGVMYAWMLSITLHLDQVEPRLIDIETRFGDQLPADLQRQIGNIRAEVFRHNGDYQKSIEDSLQVLQSLPEEFSITDQQTYTGSVTSLAWSSVLAGDMESAHKWFEESLKIGQHSITLHLLALYGLAYVYELSGQFQKAVETCLQGLDLIKETPQKIDNEVPAAVYIHFRLGNLLRERNQLGEAEKHLIVGLELGHKWNTVGDTMRDGYLDLAKLRISQGNFQGALDSLSEADKLLPFYQSVRGFGDTIDAHKAHARIAWFSAEGDYSKLNNVDRWVDGRDFSVGGLIDSINREYEYLVWVRYLITLGQHQKAINVLDDLIVSAIEKGRNGRVIEMKILQSLAHRLLGDNDSALTELETALRLAEPEGYIRLFIDEGPHMETLLRKSLANGIRPIYVSKLLEAYKTKDIIEQPQSSIYGPKSSIVEPLSERELEVLNLLSNGATNQEIAGELIIAVTTAKKHVSNIIGKLGVSNRTQAVARARELNMI